VAYEFLRIAQALAVQNMIVADGHCVVERCAKGETRLPQLLQWGGGGGRSLTSGKGGAVA
jgi:hypothetical protein